MHVSVRRWKSHTGYSLKRKRIDTFIIFILIIAIFILFLRYFLKGIVPAILNMAEDKAETDVVILIDKAIAECSELKNLRYEDIISMETDENNQVTAMSAKTVRLNEIRSELSRDMNVMLDSITETNVEVPLGMLLGFRIFSGVGVKVPFTMYPYGTAYAEFESDFKSVEINRTLHTVSIDASASVALLLPFGKHYLHVNTTVPIAETVIAGEVPRHYTFIDGLVNNERKNRRINTTAE